MPIFRATFLTRLAVIVIVLALAWTRVSESATLTLAWDQSTDPNVAGYVLYWGTHSGVYSSQSNVRTGPVPRRFKYRMDSMTAG